MGWLLQTRFGWVLGGVVALGGSVLGLSAQEAEEPKKEVTALHDGFETPEVAWQREHTDTTINLLAHERSERAAHDGKLSERFQFEADPGSRFYVSYPLPKIPVTDNLEIILNTRANRAGVQLFVRVMLPSDVDPDSGAISFVLVPGTIFDRVDRWQRLEITHMLPSIERQARVLRASSRRPVSLEGAYVDRVVVNLMGGEGPSEVFLDDLSVSPVSQAVLAAWTKPGEAKQPADSPAAADVAKGASTADYDRISLQRNRLERIGNDQRKYGWFPTAIEAPGADVALLRLYGFDVLVDDLRSGPERIQTAVDVGFSLMPRLSELRAGEGIETQVKEVEGYPFKDAAAFWMTGEGLGRNREIKVRRNELDQTRKLIRAIGDMPPTFSRLTTGIVQGELPLYARAPANLDTIGIKFNHWAAAQDQAEFFQYLLQRRRLTTKANAGQLFWAWIPATASASLRTSIWGEQPPPSWGMPQPGPEQLRLMTYLALSAGYRGIGFQGDADLTRDAGRAQLIEMGLLNEEIDIMESILAASADPIPVYPVFDPDPSDLPPPGSLPGTRVKLTKEFAPKPNHKAAAISVERKGALLLLADYAIHAQHQPHQMAAHNLVIRAVLPEGAQAWEVSPGEVKLLERVRVPGGTHIMLPEFGVTSMILCTTDMALAERVQTAILRARPMAVNLAIEQAGLMLKSAAEINGRLAADGKSITSEEDHKQRQALGLTKPFNDAADLLAKAEASIKSANDAREREDFALAWAEARRAHRPLRILAFAHWVNGYVAFAKAAALSKFKPLATESDEETKSAEPPVMVKPVSCPPAIAYNTLPELYLWLDWISGETGYQFGENRTPSGAFDDPQEMSESGWMNLSYQMEGIDAKMAVVPRKGSKTNRVIRMNATPKNPEDLDTTLPPYLDFPVVAVRSPSVQVQANNLIRISVLVKRSIASVPGQGGIIVRDSIGGEQLQFRTIDAIPQFSRIVLFRKAPTDGEFSVTLGLAGYGEAEFDDFRIELVEDGRPAPSRNGEVAQGPDDPSTPETMPELPDPRQPTSAESAEQTRPRRR